MNTCTLSKFYDGQADEVRAAEELNCDEVNASDARACAALKNKCAVEIERRAVGGSISR